MNKVTNHKVVKYFMSLKDWVHKRVKDNVKSLTTWAIILVIVPCSTWKLSIFLSCKLLCPAFYDVFWHLEMQGIFFK
jgi:hypothetical protein